MLTRAALQAVRQHGGRAVEEVWPRQRLEHRPRSQAPHVQWRAHQHPRLDRRHPLSRVQADRRKLRAAGQRPQGNCGQGPLRRRRGPEVAADGHL